MLKCPKCSNKMVEFVMIAEKETTISCSHCHYKTSDLKEIQNIKDASNIDEDMKIWKKYKKYH